MVLEVDLTRDGRYARQELITWWEQERLTNARALVVGAGALGNELVKNLALLGVGTIVIVDLDRVEDSNLARCVLFGEGDEGAAKAEVAAQAAVRLNPEVDAIGVVGDVRSALGLGVFASCDLVLGGLDNREARVHVNQACWKAGVPWIDGAIEGLMGTMRVFVPPDSACYECTMTEHDRRLLAARRACTLLSRDEMLAGKVPTTVTSASVIAGLQAQEAIKLLHADLIPYTFAGRGFAFNGITHDSYTVSYGRQRDCLAHDTYPRDAWREMDANPTFGELIALGIEDLGGDVVLDLEREILAALTCRRCDAREEVMQLLIAVDAERGTCETCGAERTPELLHSVTSADKRLLTLTPSEIGLPRFDIVTARRGEERAFYRLGTGDPLGSLR